MSNLKNLIVAIGVRNDPDMVKLLKEMTTEEVNAKYSEGIFTGTALLAACLVNNTTALVALLRMDGINVNPTFAYPSKYAQGARNWCGVNINLCSIYSGFTPIMIAARMKHKESFALLVQDDRVDLKTATVRGEIEIGLPEVLKDASNENHEMLFKMLAAMRRQKQIELSNIKIVKTTELEVLRDLAKKFGELLESSEMSDFKIICGGEVFPCHKYILLAQSNVLRTMVNNDMKESNEGQMIIGDLEPAIVKNVLKFIYTGEVTFDDSKANATKLLEVADRYELKGLTKLCEDQLVPTIDNNNVLEMIMKADLYHADILREVSMKWIAENRFEIIKQEGWKEVLLKFPNLMIDMFDAFTTKS